MRNQKWMRLAFVALLSGVILQSCSKDEVLVPESDLALDQSSNWTVRPDFATVDTRPQEVIAQFMVTENDASPIKLDMNAAKGGKYAVVVGISDYAGTSNDLQYCDDDANDWAAQLQAEGYTVNKLLDLNATKSNIEAAIATLAGQSVAGNEIAFIYSGHGSRGNIVTTDLYYINSAWFKTMFLNATSTKMMFSFDACQIGAMATDLNANGRVIAVASDTRRYSYDGDATMQNGVFTYYQMVGLDQLNYIYFEPDCQYACDQMILWAKSVRVKVAPSYIDSYLGDLDI
ncbi:MAG TPA: hypothetical protein DCG75_10665 [Bacteroidales bacterium]|jgi:hypothetical protein|nr:hypothetical protein [Bacteroidales bacterium]